MDGPSPDPSRDPAPVATMDPDSVGLSIDRREIDGLPTICIVAHRGRRGLAFAISHDRRLRLWETGSLSFQWDGSVPDRAWFKERVSFDGAHRADMADLGLVGDGTGLAGRIAGLLRSDTAAEPRPAFADPDREVSPRDTFRQMADFMFARVSSRPDGRAFGFAQDGEGRLRPAVAGMGREDGRDALQRRIANRLREGALGLADPGDREALDLLGALNWSGDAYAFYAGPGRVGQRRRQAGRLYPALAPLIAKRSEVSWRVDDGRPYETALSESLRELLPPGARDGLSVAGVRRLRTLEPCPFDVVRQATGLVAALPVDWLPADAMGWRDMLGYLGGALDEMARAGADVADLLRHVGGDWRRLEQAFPYRKREGHHLWIKDDPDLVGGVEKVLADARDMRIRLAETLVEKVRSSLGATASKTLDRRVAGRLLLGGRSLAGIDRLQARWHAGLSRLEARLPVVAESNAWPAAFPPFRAPGGLEIVCLTDESQLKAEGATGEGLDHCVGGYGRQCFAGEIHVASVRRPTPSGFGRVSTVAFEPRLHEGSVGVLFVDQHLGLRNQPASDEACEAWAALAEAISTGLHPLDPQAVGEREGDGYGESYDWRHPGAMERAFEAWSPYLPRALAAGGFPALVERVRAEIVLIEPEIEFGPAPDGFVLDIEACGLR